MNKELEPTSIDDDIHKENIVEKSDLMHTLALMLDDTNIKGKTILDNRQVTAITLMNMYGQIYDIPFLKDFVEQWCRYRISGDNGRGRTELIEIAKAIQLNREKERNDMMDFARGR